MWAELRLEETKNVQTVLVGVGELGTPPPHNSANMGSKISLLWCQWPLLFAKFGIWMSLFRRIFKKLTLSDSNLLRKNCMILVKIFAQLISEWCVTFSLKVSVYKYVYGSISNSQWHILPKPNVITSPPPDSCSCFEQLITFSGEKQASYMCCWNTDPGTQFDNVMKNVLERVNKTIVAYCTIYFCTGTYFVFFWWELKNSYFTILQAWWIYV